MAKHIHQLTHHSIHTFQSTILDRYSENKREGLPWRDSFDPYWVFVSEVMLQQTQVDRVIPKFEAFIDEVPTFLALAELDKPTLLTLRSGLWFNARALRLQQSAKIVVEQYGWDLPQDRQTLQTLPGIGRYCSASLLAFVFNKTAPVVDTNIRRVFIHELGIGEKTKPADLEAIAVMVTPEWKANDWNNALMDYGALEATAAKTGIKPTSKQSRFAWSKRQVRGNILKWLIKHGPTPVEFFATKFPHDAFDQIVNWMVADALIVREYDCLKIEK